MKQRIIAVAAALCLLAGSAVSAQNNNPKNGRMQPKERPTVEQMAQRQTERMTRELGLDETQAKQVYALNLKRIQRMEAMHAEMRKNRQAEAEQMKSLLTTDQFVKWSQMQGPMPGAHRGKMQKECCKQNKDCKRADRPCDNSQRAR